MPEIDPDKWYSFAEAAALIPSPRAGAKTNLNTLYRWRKAGRFRAESREGLCGGRVWFVVGAELLRLMPGADRGPDQRPPTPAARRREYDEVRRRLEAEGFVLPDMQD